MHKKKKITFLQGGGKHCNRLAGSLHNGPCNQKKPSVKRFSVKTPAKHPKLKQEQVFTVTILITIKGFALEQTNQ